MGFTQVWDFLKETGLLGGAFLFVYGLYSGKLRWGRDYDKLEARNEKLEEEKEKLLNTALKNAGIAAVILESNQSRKGEE